MWIIILSLCVSILFLVDGIRLGEISSLILGGFFTIFCLFCLTLGDYIETIKVERDIQIDYNNLIQEGEVIDKFSTEPLIKNNKDISFENNNQTTSFINKKVEWVSFVVTHNSKVMKIKWRHDINGFMAYIMYGMTPFESAEEAEKYLIEIK